MSNDICVSHELMLLCLDDILAILPDQVFGIYVGWAKIDSNNFLKIVVSVGWENDYCSPNRNIVSEKT